MKRQVWKAVTAALVAGIATSSALAESKIVTGSSTGGGAAAKLNLKVVIPEFIALKVGTGGIYTNSNTVDDVTLTVPELNAATDTTITATAAVAVQLVANVGNVNFSSSASGTGLTSSTNEVIPFSQISVTSSNAALPHPAFGAAATSLPAGAGKVINASTNWTFNYDHKGSTAPVGSGTFTTQITYTAAKP